MSANVLHKPTILRCGVYFGPRKKAPCSSIREKKMELVDIAIELCRVDGRLSCWAERAAGWCMNVTLVIDGKAVYTVHYAQSATQQPSITDRSISCRAFSHRVFALPYSSHGPRCRSLDRSAGLDRAVINAFSQTSPSIRLIS